MEILPIKTFAGGHQVQSVPSVEALRAMYAEVKKSYRIATAHAFEMGTMLNAVKATKKQGEFGPWLEKAWAKIDPAVADLKGDEAQRAFGSFHRNCNNWMALAETVWTHGLSGHDVKLLPSPADVVLGPEEKLSAEAKGLRQELFAFMADKTIKECMEGVAVDGDKAHRITLAHNGRTLGGRGKGEKADRRDFPRFVKSHLRELRTHLGANLSTREQGLIIAEFDQAVLHWPRWLLVAVKEKVDAETKIQEPQRITRNKALLKGELV